MKTEIKFIQLNENRFQWSVSINGQSFSYFTGLGHCKRAHKLEANNKLIAGNIVSPLEKQPENTIKLDVSKLDKETRIKLIQVTIPQDRGVTLWNLERFSFVYVTVPNVDEVLNCLFMDSQAGTETIDTAYMLETPYDVIVSDRLAQLVSYYGIEEVEAELDASDSHSEIERHLTNLILTYSKSRVDEIFILIYGNKQVKKAS